ncbi:MAG: hypothetical protein ABFC96_01050 [Thermoguttaceae bacterium]
MSDKKQVADVLIGRDYWDVPVQVKLRAYLRFGRRMDSQLRRLVARWSHTASPAARGAINDVDQPDTLRPFMTRPPPLTEETSPSGQPWNRRPRAR